MCRCLFLAGHLPLHGTAQLHRIISIHLGTPPSSFTWNYADKDKAFHSVPDLTPLQFYQQHGCLDLDDYVSLIHDPRNTPDALYTVKYLGNVVGGAREQVRHLNVDIEAVRSYCQTQLDQGLPVWFGCDSGQ